MRPIFLVLLASASVMLACGGNSATRATSTFPPRSGTVIYFRDRFPFPYALVAVNADGSRPRQLFPIEPNSTSPRQVVSASCSPDGKRIVYELGYDGTLIVAKIDGSEATNISQKVGVASQPSWSPDGHRIAFVRPERRPGGLSSDGQIWVMDADGANARPLTAGSDMQPLWSPDGSRLAFTSYRDGAADIYTMAADGTDQRNVTNSPSTSESASDWSPDGQHIVFEVFPETDANIHLINPATGEQDTITLQGYDGATVPGWEMPWMPYGLKWSPDGHRLAFSAPIPVAGRKPSVSRGAVLRMRPEWGVYVASVDGRNTRRVDREQDAVFLTWCP